MTGLFTEADPVEADFVVAVLVDLVCGFFGLFWAETASEINANTTTSEMRFINLEIGKDYTCNLLTNKWLTICLKIKA